MPKGHPAPLLAHHRVVHGSVTSGNYPDRQLSSRFDIQSSTSKRRFYYMSPPEVVKDLISAKFEICSRLSLETVTMPQSNAFFQKTVSLQRFFFHNTECLGTQSSPLAKDGKGPRNGPGDRSCSVMISPGRPRLQGRNPGSFWH